ncbi:MAG: ABC transporter ATP-binding protein [Leptolyngbya sp. SIO1E4]|nr:ABC transporter ATP-binding protein [Leptolyngbya sp. SIO1E4]
MPSIWQLLWQMIRYAQRLYWVDTLLWLFIFGLPAVPGVLIREFFDSLTHQSQLDGSAWVWIGLLLATGLARVVVIFTGRITKTQHRFTMSALVRHNLLLALLQRPGAELAAGAASGRKTSPGELLSYFRDDAFQIEDTVVGTNEIFAAGVFAIGSVTLLLSVNATMTLLVFLPMCAIATLAHQAARRLKRYRRASRQATQQVTGLIGEIFTAVQAVKVAGAETSVLEELTARCDRRRELMVRDQVFTAILDSGFANIISFGTGLLLLVASQNLGAQGDLTVGDFALFVYYLSFVTYFLEFLGTFLATTKQSEVSFERMSELLERERVDGSMGERIDGLENRRMNELATQATPTPPLLHSSTPPPIHSSHPITHPHPLYLKPIFGAQPPLPSRSPTTPRDPLQELRVAGLTYHYPNRDSRPDSKAEHGITNISFTLKRGSLTVITGRVGAGKTTLLRVLLGLLPMQSGRLFWNGQRLQDPANFLVPPQAAYTPQVPQLFSASLRDNLLLGLDANKATQIEAALSTVAFTPDLATMPNRLETPIGTRGFRLSGGQKQRIAAARMLLRQPELLVFDDLSSALDVETERQLWKELLPPPLSHSPTSSLHDSPTFLAVSHRPAVLQQADQIIVLEAGEMIFAGTPQEFFARS